MTSSRRDVLLALAGLAAGTGGVGAHLIGRREFASAGEGAVDRPGGIRAYHRTDDPESLARLRENLRVLLAER
jgi:hypothetical protein